MENSNLLDLLSNITEEFIKISETVVIPTGYILLAVDMIALIVAAFIFYREADAERSSMKGVIFYYTGAMAVICIILSLCSKGIIPPVSCWPWYLSIGYIGLIITKQHR